VNAALGWWWADPIVALGLAVVAVREGRQALDGRTCGRPCMSTVTTWTATPATVGMTSRTGGCGCRTGYRPVLRGPVSAVWWAWAALVLYLVGLGLAFGGQDLGAGAPHQDERIPRPLRPPWVARVVRRVAFPAALLFGVATPVLVLTGATSVRAAHARGDGRGRAGARGRWAGGRAARPEHDGRLVADRVDGTGRTELVTSKVFRWIRNPIFTGMAAVSAGVVLMAPTLIAALTWLAWSRRCRSKSVSCRSHTWPGPAAIPTSAIPRPPDASCPESERPRLDRLVPEPYSGSV
jgi:hypothetical protein